MNQPKAPMRTRVAQERNCPDLPAFGFKLLPLATALAAALTASTAIGALPGGTLDPTSVPQFVEPLPVPEVMPPKALVRDGNKVIPYYEIEAVQFNQQILPAGLPPTTVFSYAAAGKPATRSYPARTIETLKQWPLRVKWINNLVSNNGKYLSHLLPIDQTLHWANPPQETIDDMGMPSMRRSDSRGMSQEPYTGPIPMVPHLHGAHVTPESDGYPEAWFLPAAKNIPSTYARQGTHYDDIAGGSGRNKGFAVFQYPNDQRATTLWFHDHTLGMTRANVYAGLAGFYLIRDLKELTLGLPLREIPILIQDKSFNADGSLYYPDNRAFFEGLNSLTPPEQFPGAGFLDIPFIPQGALSGERSDVSPIWNPEFFGNTMVVNGKTWPYVAVAKARYRLRFLNGCDSRFLILTTDKAGFQFSQIGADGGLLPAPAHQDRLLIAPAERADVIVDFSDYPAGTEITLLNLGPDEPFGGGEPGEAFEPADPDTTGKVLKFIVAGGKVLDWSKPATQLTLPAVPRLGEASYVRKLSLNEDMSMTVGADFNVDGNLVEVPYGDGALAFGPTSARLGILDAFGNPVAKSWMEDVTENPMLGDTEIWEIYNFTADAHPIHIHLVQFEAVNREALVSDADGVSLQPATLTGIITGPEPWETGTKDTLIVYPGTVARLKAKFDLPGLFVWHCHILSHEDNEMMRPFQVVP